ncbi:hypothetical protein [Pseudokineococcus sp. 1T1Z-3]|uniref:hypothetical protein n=1 Tax=Pseudokineococcus sp. 1T1Z-3 TaxID=3132745 RepID=UPI0030956971
MPRVSKIVRFYQAVHLDQQEQSKEIDGDFWGKLHSKLATLDPDDREYTYSFNRYYGEARTPSSWPSPYIYFGRLRPPADTPDTYRPKTGVLGPLQVGDPDDRISEPTFLVPLNRNNQVAVMTPVIGATREAAIESWLSAVLGLTTTGDRIELRPLVDLRVLEKLARRAQGASKLTVAVPAGTPVPVDGGGGQTAQAIAQAAAARTSSMALEQTWSMGYARDSQSTSRLLDAARWITRGRWASRAEVTMLVPREGADGQDDGGVENLRAEQHNLLRDVVTIRASFGVDADKLPDEASVLGAIDRAIARLRKEHPNL